MFCNNWSIELVASVCLSTNALSVKLFDPTTSLRCWFVFSRVIPSEVVTEPCGHGWGQSVHRLPPNWNA